MERPLPEAAFRGGHIAYAIGRKATHWTGHRIVPPANLETVNRQIRTRLLYQCGRTGEGHAAMTGGTIAMDRSARTRPPMPDGF